MSCRPVLFTVLLLALGVSSVARGAEPPSDGERLFVSKVRPLLTERCLACHGADEAKIKGGLDLRSRESTLRGGDSGEAAILPGKPTEQSPLIRAVLRNDGVGRPS